jgi:hypothetical protein
MRLNFLRARMSLPRKNWRQSRSMAQTTFVKPGMLKHDRKTD